MTIERLIALVSGILFLLALSYYLMSDRHMELMGDPVYQGKDMSIFDTRVPQIEDFDYFNINKENPFIPYDDRKIENQEPQSPSSSITVEEPPAPAVTGSVPPHTRLLPKLPHENREKWPHCQAMVSASGAQAIWVTMAGQDGPKRMNIKDVINGWQLMGIEAGNFARFTDPSGTEQIILIADADLGAPQNLATPSSDAKDGPKNPNTPNKPKNPNAPAKKDGSDAFLTPQLYADPVDGPVQPPPGQTPKNPGRKRYINQPPQPNP